MIGKLFRNTKRAVALAIAFVLIGGAGLLAIWWFTFRIYVPPNKCAVLIRKMGDPQPPGQLVASDPNQRGIQQEVLGPGRYFYNPVVWDYELKPLTEIPSGNPATWQWTQKLSDKQREELRAGKFSFVGQFPQVGVVTRRIGKEPTPGQVIVSAESGVMGILQEVLTPGVYKLNPYVYDVELHSAIVIPAGFVGVVTNLFDEHGVESASQTGTAEPADAQGPVDSYVEGDSVQSRDVRPLAAPGRRGTQRNVLQPGIYYLNPKLQAVNIIEIGFHEYSQVKESESENFRISFPSDTGYLIRVGVTVVWGIDPRHAAEIINEFGNTDGVLEKVIGPQLRSICRNIGSTYAARDFIQGEKREKFQRDLTTELQRVCRAKNLEVLIALVLEIEVLAPSAGAGGGGEVTEDLKRTIQQSHIAIENQITKEKQRTAATVRAQLEEERKKVEIAREVIRADSRVMVAKILADGDKAAATVDAQAALEVAAIQEEVAKLDARRTEILGKARADVEKMKKDAEAKGYQLLVDAFGGGNAYNLYTFAEKFNPDSINLFYAGEGTFWTDLTRLEQVGAAKMIQEEK